MQMHSQMFILIITENQIFLIDTKSDLALFRKYGLANYFILWISFHTLNDFNLGLQDIEKTYLNDVM